MPKREGEAVFSFGRNMYPRSPDAELCLSCRGAKMLCGRSFCPVLIKAKAYASTPWSLNSAVLEGLSLGVFVGRAGYPRVYAGPTVAPPGRCGTDTPELWGGVTFEKFIEFRASVLRGRHVFRVEDASHPSSLLERVQEIALASTPPDSQLFTESPPTFAPFVNEDAGPFGASVTYKDFSVKGLSSESRLENAYYDFDLDSRLAISELYRKGVYVTSIQKAFSLGMLGRKKVRRLVPTRWSITAVDSTLGMELVEQVKGQPSVSDYSVFHVRHLESTYVGFLIPGRWSFEWVEAWQPGTVWNLLGRGASLTSDREYHTGRSTYAEPGGCYYAARLASAEYLSSIRRQARVVLLREIHPGYAVPLGVWCVREGVRSLFRSSPVRFSSMNEALSYGILMTTLPFSKWSQAARLLVESLRQTVLRLDD